MIRRPPRSTQSRSSAASDVYKRQKQDCATLPSAVRAIYGEQIVFGGKIVEKLPDLINRQESFNYKDFDITAKESQLIE